jgi:hypothetical protein
MNKLIALVGVAAMIGVGTVAAATPATAAPWGYNHGYGRPYYGRGYYGRGYYPGAAIGAGILGFAAGAAIAGAAANNSAGWRAHVADCSDAYRSYDPRSDTYLGYDGLRHRCAL